MKKVKIITKQNPIYLIRLIKDTHSKYFKNTKFKDFIPNFYGIAQCVEYNDKDPNKDIILKNEMYVDYKHLINQYPQKPELNGYSISEEDFIKYIKDLLDLTIYDNPTQCIQLYIEEDEKVLEFHKYKYNSNEMFFQSVNNIKKEINITSIKSFEIYNKEDDK